MLYIAHMKLQRQNVRFLFQIFVKLLAILTTCGLMKSPHVMVL